MEGDIHGEKYTRKRVIGCCESVTRGGSLLWVCCYWTVAVGWLLIVDCGSVAMGQSLWVSDRLVTVGGWRVRRCGSRHESVAVDWSLWVYCCGSVAVGLSRVVHCKIIRVYVPSKYMYPPGICPVHLHMCLPCIFVFHLYTFSICMCLPYICVFHTPSQNNRPRATISKRPSPVPERPFQSNCPSNCQNDRLRATVPQPIATISE